MAINSTSSNTLIRLDMSRNNEYLKADYYKPKLSFMQKLGRTVGKAVSFLGPIAAAVTSFIAPPVGAGLYGLSSLANNLTARAQAKDQANISAEFSKVSQMPVAMPGFFEQGTEADMKTSFITPESMVQPTINAVMSREYSSQSAIENFNF